jgi:hypothetical protein
MTEEKDMGYMQTPEMPETPPQENTQEELAQ